MATLKMGGIKGILPEVLNLREDLDPGARIFAAFRLMNIFGVRVTDAYPSLTDVRLELVTWSLTSLSAIQRN